MTVDSSPVDIRRWRDIPAAERLVPAIEAILFGAAATQTFPDAIAKAEFRERWLGRYLDHYGGEAWIAIDREGRVAGYLVGCLDDPAQGSRFADIGYFPLLAPHTRSFPAHLHINLDARWRGRGIGARLIEAFVGDLAARGIPGVHVVTGAGMRNVAFYARNGFAEVHRFAWNGRDLVMLARRLT